VAVISGDKSAGFILNKKEVDTKYCRSQGPGGQHVNRTESCVLLTHIPTGLQVKCQDTRYRHQNEQIAWERLTERLAGSYNNVLTAAENLDRKNQVGSGMRGDKRRTYQVKHNTVTDHISGKRCDMNSIYKGEIMKLHP
jgi:peptide chain release factor 1